MQKSKKNQQEKKSNSTVVILNQFYFFFGLGAENGRHEPKIRKVVEGVS